MNTTLDMRETLLQRKAHASQRLAWLGPVRMLVIAFIAFGYASTMPRGPETAEYLRMFGYDPSWYGISLIFMISGFLAMRSLQRHGSPKTFLVSRLVRNIPLLALFALMVILVLFPLFAVPPEIKGARLSQHISYFLNVVSCYDPDIVTPGLLDNAFYMCIIQGGLWTFRWGLIAFVATAMLWQIGGLRHRITVLILTLALVVTFAALRQYGTQHASSVLDLVLTGLRLGWAFLAGMCLYLYRRNIPRTVWVAVGFIALAAVQYIFLPWTAFIEISADLGLGYVVFLAMTRTDPVPTALKRIPDLSLGLYVFNWPVAQITLLVLPTLSPLGLFALSFPLTVIISLACWAILVRPINLLAFPAQHRALLARS